MQELDDLSKSEAEQLRKKLQQIIDLSDAQAKSGVFQSHEIYVLARDCRELLVFDSMSREMMAKLSQPEQVVIKGHLISNAVQQAVAEGRKIEAIKLFREQTGLGLYDAKTIVEEFILSKNSW